MELNVRAVLAAQQLGMGQRGVETVSGLLGINGMAAKWFTGLEERIGVVEIDLGKEIIHENLTLESDLLPWNETLQCWGLSMAMDAGWTNHGKSYNFCLCQHVRKWNTNSHGSSITVLIMMD